MRGATKQQLDLMVKYHRHLVCFRPWGYWFLAKTRPRKELKQRVIYFSGLPGGSSTPGSGGKKVPYMHTCIHAHGQRNGQDLRTRVQEKEAGTAKKKRHTHGVAYPRVVPDPTAPKKKGLNNREYPKKLHDDFCSCTVFEGRVLAVGLAVGGCGDVVFERIFVKPTGAYCKSNLKVLSRRLLR